MRARRWGYCLFYLLASVEVYVASRYVVKQWVKTGLSDVFGTVANQRIFQGALLLVAAAILLAVVANYLSSRKKTPRMDGLLWFGTMFVLMVFALDIISLHQVDRILYAYAGFLRRSAWMMALGALFAAWGAWKLGAGGKTARRREQKLLEDSRERIMWPSPYQD